MKIFANSRVKDLNRHAFVSACGRPGVGPDAAVVLKISQRLFRGSEGNAVEVHQATLSFGIEKHDVDIVAACLGLDGA